MGVIRGTWLTGFASRTAGGRRSDGGPEIGTHCRRWARTNDGVDSTEARLVGGRFMNCWPRG